MLRFLGGCAGRLLGMVLLLGVLAVAWYNRDHLAGLLDTGRDNPPEASAELAADALVELEELLTGERSRTSFHQAELQSLIQYVWASGLPEELVDPRVSLGSGRVTLEGGVPTARLGRIDELRDLLAFLPDTASLRADGSFVPLDSTHVALEIHGLGAAGIPIPRRLIPPILARLRPPGGPEVGPNVLALPLPPGVAGVYVSGDSLVITAHETGGA